MNKGKIEIAMRAHVKVEDFVVQTNPEFRAAIEIVDGKISEDVAVHHHKTVSGVGLDRADVIYADIDELRDFCEAFLEAYRTAVGVCHRMKALKSADQPAVRDGEGF